MTPTQKRSSAVALAVALAVPAEGLRQWAYNDIANPSLLTVCYGTTGPGVQRGKFYTLEQCKSMLDRDMMFAVETVNRCAPGLPDKTLAAFADAVYNMGPTIACDKAKSTAARLLAAGNVRGACQQLPRWSMAKVAGVMVSLPGLEKRRAAETALCLEGLS